MKGKYRIYISSFDGLKFTGIACSTEEEAQDLCKKYNEQNDSLYCEHVYVEV